MTIVGGIIGIIGLIIMILGFIKADWMIKTFDFFNKKWQVIVSGLIIMAIGGFMIPQPSMPNTGTPKDTKVVQEEQKKELTEAEKTELAGITMIKEKMAVTEEQAKGIYNSLKEAGILHLQSISTVDEKAMSYQIKAQETGLSYALAVLNDAKKIDTLSLNGSNLIAQGKMVQTVTSQIVTDEEQHKAADIAMECIKARLIDPSSMDFKKDTMHVTKNNNIIYITGDVNAKNAYNKVQTHHYTVKWNTLDNTYGLVSMT